MKTFLHTLNTWALSVALCLAGVIAQAMYSGEDIPLDIQLLPVVVLSFMLTLPFFFVAWGLLGHIIKSAQPFNEKLLLWYCCALLSVVFNVIIILLFSSPEMINRQILMDVWPGYASVFVVITVRLRPFIRLNIPEEINWTR